jgi:sulfide:quinone oxidoreductase
MKTLLILGAGTAGTIVANKMAKKLDAREWRVVVVDRDERHIYQPGLLFVPFGYYSEADVIKPRRRQLSKKVRLVIAEIESIDRAGGRVKLAGQPDIPYDQLVIALGCGIAPEETPGLRDGPGWRRNIFDFYTLDGAVALRDFMKNWQGGRLVLNITEYPIKCPVAPLEFLFLADCHFTRRGIRDKVRLTLVTPAAGAFTKPVATATLAGMLGKKGIEVVPYFDTHEIDSENNRLVSYGQKNREIPYDLLVTIPVNKGAEVIGRSGLGDFSNFVNTNPETLQAVDAPNIWVVGDATNTRNGKAGSAAHFMADAMVANLEGSIRGEPPPAKYDGHTNCFIESGFGRALLIDYSYTQEPLPGKYPLPVIGPCSLLGDTRINHWGKLAFRWIYWHILLPGRPLPVSSKFKKP